MIKVEKVTVDEMTEAIRLDIEGRNEESLSKLQMFYYKIVIEDQIRTTSYRYQYAKLAIDIICETLNDQETALNLSKFHSSKLAFEKANPVTKIENTKATTTTSSDRKFSSAIKDKSATQFKI
jgi:hypothetical protein